MRCPSHTPWYYHPNNMKRVVLLGKKLFKIFLKCHIWEAMLVLRVFTQKYKYADCIFKSSALLYKLIWEFCYNIQSQWPRGLRPPEHWNCGFESRSDRGWGMSMVFCCPMREQTVQGLLINARTNSEYGEFRRRNPWKNSFLLLHSCNFNIEQYTELKCITRYIKLL
jgi:hypothetical protein